MSRRYRTRGGTELVVVEQGQEQYQRPRPLETELVVEQVRYQPPLEPPTFSIEVTNTKTSYEPLTPVPYNDTYLKFLTALFNFLASKKE